MRKVAIPEDSFASTGLIFSHDDGAPVAKFSIPGEGDSDPVFIAAVATDGTHLRFFPERSAAQAALLIKLGLSTQ